jgi:UPF0755 protein
MVFLPHKISAGAQFRIEPGQSLGSTGRLLAQKDYIYNRFLFVGYAILTGQEKGLKAGNYDLPGSASVRDLVSIFTGGGNPEDVTVTVPEGTNLADMDRIFSKTGLTRPGDLLGPQMAKMEGYLFPDTYRFRKDASAADIISRLENNFNNKTADLGLKLSDEKFRRAVIVASMLEKEVRTPQDMRLVAGIIEKRLARNMPLQIDATVAYGVCRSKLLLGQYCDVSEANVFDNLKTDSPYNTYKNTGLPAGPISNPGLAAIRAALDPQPSDYLFYLSAKDGTTIFSKTLEEHNAAKAKYLR